MLNSQCPIEHSTLIIEHYSCPRFTNNEQRRRECAFREHEG